MHYLLLLLCNLLVYSSGQNIGTTASIAGPAGRWGGGQNMVNEIDII